MKELIIKLQYHALTIWEIQFLAMMTRKLEQGIKMTEMQLIHTWDIAVKYEYMFN